MTRLTVPGALILLVLMVAGCSAHNLEAKDSSSVSTSTAVSTTRIPSTAAQRQLAVLQHQITSSSPEQREDALYPSLAKELRGRRILPAGTSLSIETSTIRSSGHNGATVLARTGGSHPGDWKLYLIRFDGVWKLVGAYATK